MDATDNIQIISTKRFRWSDALTCLLMKKVYDYKTQKEFEGVDFECDLVRFYGDIREGMAEDHPDEFGPVCVSPPLTSGEVLQKNYQLLLKQQNKEIKNGYLKIKEKVKNIRQSFKKAVNEGTRSGAGKLVIENWDLLKDIWGHCPSVTKIPGAVNSSRNDNSDLDVSEEEDFVVVPPNGCETNDSQLAEEAATTSGKKRKGTAQYVDDKRKKLEKKMSSTEGTLPITNCE